MIPADSPPIAVATQSCSSVTLKPYLPSASRLGITDKDGTPVTCSIRASAAPSTVFTIFRISFAVSNNRSKSSPNILMPTSALTPEINSLKRI